MHDHDPWLQNHVDQHLPDYDHWEEFARAMDLTIEGHRLIAQEIVHEGKLLGRAVARWLRALIGTSARRRSSPPV